MNTTITRVPPGFRFHPTDEELVDYYLRRKVTSRRIDLDVIKDVDLYKIEPWDLQELCRIGTEEQNDQWYFFSHKDKKYPTGTRTNRATSAGFWKATGRDKAIYSKCEIVGMRKTLVFYKGRAPNGQKSDWIMHEYRLETDENGTTSQEEGWVVCKVFKKRIAATVRTLNERESPNWYDDQVSFMADMDSPRQHHSHMHHPNQHHNYPNYASCKKEMILQYGVPPHHFLQLPNLESPKFLHPQASMGRDQMPSVGALNIDPLPSYQTLGDHMSFQSMLRNNSEQCVDEVTDWRVLDKFVASQLSQDEISKENEIVNRQELMAVMENGSTSSSSCQIDLWK